MIRYGLADLTTPHFGQEPRSLLPANLRRAAKRMLDATVSLALLVLLSPLFVILIAAIRRDGGTAFYSHRRIGRGGASFGCLKFRSMAMDADQLLAEQLRTNPAAAAEWATRRKLQHDPRITALGAILRQTSLDELPQLINVLRGEMSLVGPRPVVVEELQDHYGRPGARANRGEHDGRDIDHVGGFHRQGQFQPEGRGWFRLRRGVGGLRRSGG